jgi:hypothetical protein
MGYNMATKAFNPILFKENDRLARAAGKKYWQSLGYDVIDNPDRYGADLIVDNKFYCEVEIKKVWSGKEFKYDTLQVPERKKKFANLDMPCKFIVFNNEQSHGFLCEGETLMASPVVEVPNRYVYKGEFFFQVPVANTQLIEVPNHDNDSR